MRFYDKYNLQIKISQIVRYSSTRTASIRSRPNLSIIRSSPNSSEIAQQRKVARYVHKYQLSQIYPRDARSDVHRGGGSVW